MSEPSTWIKLDRNITKWGWYKDINTKAVFIHLLLKANIKDGSFLGHTIKRGEIATSQSSLAHEIGISIFSVRTALRHLQATGEVTVKATPKFSVISVVNYNKYQDSPQANPQATTHSATRSTHSRPTGDNEVNPQQSKNIKNVKNGKNIKGSPPAKEYKPKKWEKEHLPPSLWNRFDSEEEWREWDAR